ncbi:MAG: diguanylate cyclase [Deltaproteobacteria bacterium]|nr:diguanylate cyclase [Deltaproteobacteria bacterium]
MYSILVADDDEGLRVALSDFLKKHQYEVVNATNGKEVLKLMEHKIPDVLLLDMVMPHLNGIEVLREIKKNIHYYMVYIIMITVDDSLESKVTGLDCGADDYIVKPFDLKELLARIRAGIRSIEARNFAFRDPLTDLYNRHFFNQNLVQEIDRSERYGMPLSMILLDVDYFKNVNDTYGHLAGDELLIEIASILIHFCRVPDIACRWGGDEFILLLPNTSSEGVKILGQRIIEQVEEHQFNQVGKITISAGASTLEKDQIDLFQMADKALYKAKDSGRNRVIFL